MQFKYRGHNDTYLFDTDAEVPEFSSDLLRFATITIAPYSIVYNINHTESKFWYNIAGPGYSLLKEMALKGNLSIYYYDVHQNTEEVFKAVVMKFVDTFAVPTYAAMQRTHKMWSYDFAFPIPFATDTMSMDHVVYRVDHAKRKIFHFCSSMDSYIWTSFFLSILAVSAVNHLIEPSNSFLKNVWYHGLIGFSPIRGFQKRWEKFLTALWCALCVVMANCYQAEFFRTVTMEPSAILIDSWSDLAARGDVWRVVAGDNTLDDRDMDDTYRVANATAKYIIKDSMFYSKLTKKLKLYPVDDILEDNFRDAVYLNASRGVAALMSQKEASNYFVHHFRDGKFRHQLHVSAHGGDCQPMFVSFMTPPSNHSELMKAVVLQLTESGIYGLWSRLMVDKLNRNHGAKVKDAGTPLGARIFVGLYIVFSACAPLFCFVLFVETQWAKSGARNKYSVRSPKVKDHSMSRRQNKSNNYNTLFGIQKSTYWNVNNVVQQWKSNSVQNTQITASPYKSSRRVDKRFIILKTLNRLNTIN